MAGRIDYGKAIGPNGLRYLSPSALTTADPESSDGCLRKYWFQYHEGIKEPSTKAQQIGTDLHAEIEQYLLTGTKALSSLALSGLHMVPTPGPDLLVEYPIAGDKLETAPLRASGIPIVGYIDLIHERGTNQGTADVEDTVDPPGCVEVLDWKTTSNEKWIKEPAEMASTLQMISYGRFVTTINPDVEHIRLSHGYFVTKGKTKTRKVSLRVTPDHIEKHWTKIERLAAAIKDVAVETNPDKVPANLRACSAYRGCPHANYCSAAMHNSLADIVGHSMARQLLANAPKEDMSILDKMKKPSPAVQAEIDRLKAEETAASPIVTMRAKIEAYGLGFPALGGAAALAHAKAMNQTLDGSGYAGTGELAEYTIMEVSDLNEVLEDVAKIVEERAKAPAGVKAPVAVQESAPIVAEEPAVTAEVATSVPSLLPPDAPKRGRPKKPAPLIENNTSTGEQHAIVFELSAEPAPSSTTVVNVQNVASAARTETFATGYNAIVSSAINLFVDCVPSCQAESFWTIIQKVTTNMNEFYKCDDYRSSDHKDLSFGKGKGILSAMIKAIPIPPGNYTLDGATTETAQIVAEAMREVCAKSGGLFVRGTR